MPVRKIISGGQTGVDRAALDVALARGIPHGGWCPNGRWAEDGALDARYQLAETPGADPAQRTEWNVQAADATLILSCGPLAGGTELTRRLALALGKPLLVIDLAATSPEDAASAIAAWLDATPIATLNIAGPRASQAPGGYDLARAALEAALRGDGHRAA